jgi:hypothetical protein
VLVALVATGCLINAPPAPQDCHPTEYPRLRARFLSGDEREYTGANGGGMTEVFAMSAPWRVSWTSELGELHIRLYDGSIRGRERILLSIMSDTSHSPKSGTRDLDLTGSFCLGVSSGFHSDPEVDVSKLRTQWRVVVQQLR